MANPEQITHLLLILSLIAHHNQNDCALVLLILTIYSYLINLKNLKIDGMYENKGQKLSQTFLQYQKETEYKIKAAVIIGRCI